MEKLKEEAIRVFKGFDIKSKAKKIPGMAKEGYKKAEPVIKDTIEVVQPIVKKGIETAKPAVEKNVGVAKEIDVKPIMKSISDEVNKAQEIQKQKSNGTYQEIEKDSQVPTQKNNSHQEKTPVTTQTSEPKQTKSSNGFISIVVVVVFAFIFSKFIAKRLLRLLF